MAEPQIARTLFMVDVAEIDASGGLRPLDPAWVEALGGMLAADGQRRAIEIYPKRGGGYGVIAGRHRLAAAKRLGWTTIDADILQEPALDRRLAEVSDNLHRLGLNPIDRAAFVAEQIAVLKARAGVDADATAQSIAATARWSERIRAEANDASDIVSHAYGWTDEVAEALGLNRRTIERDLELHRGLRPDVVEALRGHPIASNAAQLRTLARLTETDQRQAVELLIEGTAKSASDAVGILKQKAPPDAAKKAWNAFTGSWGRMNRPTQRLALIEILGHKSTAPELKALLKHLETPEPDASPAGGDHG